jgi:Flp pilus assembly protein TadG
MNDTDRRRSRRLQRGQSLVEFSVVLVPFLFLLMGVADLGRGIYTYNGVAEAAREIARTTSVHPCTGSPCVLGSSAQTQAVISTQKNIVPGLADPSALIAITCTDLGDNALSSTDCQSGSFARVAVSVQFSAVTPLVGLLGPITLSSTSHVELP